MTYADSGVHYADIDPAKVLAQHYAPQTISWPHWLNVKPVEEFRGESAYVLRLPDGSHIAHVEEGLGTKVLLADFMYNQTRDSKGYDVVGEDTVAMIVNDLATLGVPPVSLQMHLAVGGGDWLKDPARIHALYQGWLNGAFEAEVAWTGGETPVLKDIVAPNTAVIAGSAVGYLSRRHSPIREKIVPGDAIIMLTSSGVHANGITLIRKIAEQQSKAGLEDLYRRTLVPTRIYVKAMNALLVAKIIPHYAVHITGHGWRKIMRAHSPFTYVIESIPWPIPDIFTTIQKLGNIEPEEMWGNYNMGAGWALIVARKDVDLTLKVCCDAGYASFCVGHVENGPKQVVIKPIGLSFKDESMKLR